MRSLTTLPRTTLLVAISVVIVIAMLFANGVIAPDATQNRSTGGFIGGSLFGIACCWRCWRSSPRSCSA